MAKTLREIIEKDPFPTYISGGVVFGFITGGMYLVTRDFEQSLTAACGGYVGYNLLGPVVRCGLGKILPSKKESVN